ncbi:MAG: PKD domain-containing protein, partial [Dolichospermum sp.]
MADKICALDSTTITNQSVFKTGAVNYSWSRTSPLNSLMSFSSTTVNQPSIYFPENIGSIDSVFQIRLVVTSVNSCVDDTIRPITQLRRPNANFVTGANINCGPANYTMSNGTTNVGSTYLWSVSPTSGVFLINNNSTNPQITLPVNTSNAVINYEVKLIATRNTAELGCRDTFTAPLLVYPKPLTNFTMSPSSSGCSPQTVLFTNASDPKNSENIGEMRFVWSFTGMATDTNPSLSRTFYNRTGIIDSLYNITLIGTSKWGCKDTMSSSVTVYPFPKSDFTGTNYSNCAPFLLNGTNISLTQYAIANDTYIWQILDKGMNVISTSTGTNIPTYTINQANDTVYYRLITSNVHGCKPDTLTRLFRTISNPKADFALSDSVGCHPLNINITSLSTVGVGHSWSFGNGSTSTSTNPNQSYINNSNTIDSTYQIRLVVTAGTGCTDTLKKSITVYPKPLASFILADKICALDSTTITNQSVFKTGAVNYAWTRTSPANSLMSFSSITSNQPSIYFPENTGSIDSVFQIRLVVTSVNS